MDRPVLNTVNLQIQNQIQESLDLLKIVLGTDLLGIYLYGSSIVGGLQKYSDIDLLVVVSRSMTLDERKQIIAHLLKISGIYMKSIQLPIEMTFVRKAAINPWHYPPQFDFQYGEWLRASFEHGKVDLWPTQEMPDLALIITQVLLKNHILFGLEPKQLLPKVPYGDFVRAMLHDLGRLTEDLEHDTRNVLLTYARIWSTLKTNAIRSKPAAADWAIPNLPEAQQVVMRRAKAICVGLESEHWEDIASLIKPCADFMRAQIHQASLLIDLNDSNNHIKLAE
nr:DUF4111 domain-containing protein [Legionella jordanis]